MSKRRDSYTEEEKQFLQQLGYVVRAARQARGWTQIELAVRARSFQNGISLLEKANATPEILTLLGVAQAFEVTLAQFIQAVGDGDPAPLIPARPRLGAITNTTPNQEPHE